jgi:hypothetical protein
MTTFPAAIVEAEMEPVECKDEVCSRRAVGRDNRARRWRRFQIGADLRAC